MSARYGTAIVQPTILKLASARYSTAIVQCPRGTVLRWFSVCAVPYHDSSVPARYSSEIVQCMRCLIFFRNFIVQHRYNVRSGLPPSLTDPKQIDSDPDPILA